MTRATLTLLLISVLNIVDIVGLEKDLCIVYECRFLMQLLISLQQDIGFLFHHQIVPLLLQNMCKLVCVSSFFPMIKEHASVQFNTFITCSICKPKSVHYITEINYLNFIHMFFSFLIIIRTGVCLINWSF